MLTTDLFTFTLLIIAFFITVFLLWLISKNITKGQLKTAFLCILVCMLTCLIGLIAQVLLSKRLDINPFFFEYIVYIGNCFLPVALFFATIIFTKTKIEFRKSYLLLFVIPIISLLVLWTNNLHHLFYVNYSINLDENIYGSYFYVYDIYTLGLYLFSLVYLLRYSIKNSGIFSKQAVLIIVAALVPIILNCLGAFNIVPMTIYITNISFAITCACLSLAFFKFNFLKVTPIALQRIVDRISDSYIVLNEFDVITDFNQTFIDTFQLEPTNVRNVNLFDLLATRKNHLIDNEILRNTLEEVKNSSKTASFDKEFKAYGKYFHIEINTIISNGKFLGTLILFKDITQHMQDMQTIQDNQNMLMERERLASLGQLIGGIAHNLKTPIMSISGAAEGLSDLVKEYEVSVGDPEVTVDDHHDIAKDMKGWIEKIRDYTEYMSDVITAVKGQAVTMSEEQAVSFTLDELVKRVNILMKHELKNALVTLNIKMETDSNTVLHGNINSLVQVINNMISNSIQAYNDVPNNEINLILDQSDNKINISIEDFAGGLPKEVQEKLFKEMITTKGKNGSGLGLFMSYSTIRAHFNGNITFKTEKGKGTIFCISLPA